MSISAIPATPRPITPPAAAPAHDHGHGHSHAPVAPDGPVDGVPSYLDPDVVAQRLEQGRIAEYTQGSLPPGIVAAGAPSYFRSYDQVKTAMYDLAKRFPDLVEVADIGDTSEKVRGIADRDVLALRLTNKASNPGAKPSAFYIAGEHAREIANPELMMKFATQLLEGYGKDPEATALLDTRLLTIVPMMNADGHAVIERGYTKQPGGGLMQRKNTSPPSGTDLNRNYEFHWGGPGAGTNPGSDTYRGPSAASEPEVQAIQREAAASKPGVFLDWHSYSRLNLFPWGDTKDPTPDHAGFDALARKFSTWNHYTPQQAIKLYPTSGTSKDFMYGQLGIPGFTIETGDTFHQSDKQFEESWALNLPVMTYAAKVADAPFQRVKGPDTLDVNVASGAPGLKDGLGRLTAQISDATSGKDAVKAAEWTTSPLSAPGTGTPLNAVDGAFNGATEVVTGDVPLDAGKLVYVRAQDAAGNWGPATPQWLQTPGGK